MAEILQLTIVAELVPQEKRYSTWLAAQDHWRMEWVRPLSVTQISYQTPIVEGFWVEACMRCWSWCIGILWC